MKLYAVIIGINRWKQYTEPFIQSLLNKEPLCNIVLIDNGSENPYSEIDGVLLKRIPLSSYAAAINVGIKLCTNADWILILNNDMLCDNSFYNIVTQLSPDVMYGDTLQKAWGGYTVGHLMLISRKILNTVGYFDEQFEVAAFEDVDYCRRVKNAGFSIQKQKFPITHFEGKTRYDISKYSEIRELNRKRFLEKYRQ
jgi:GT2 family glycosyltransferase